MIPMVITDLLLRVNGNTRLKKFKKILNKLLHMKSLESNIVYLSCLVNMVYCSHFTIFEIFLKTCSYGRHQNDQRPRYHCTQVQKKASFSLANKRCSWKGSCTNFLQMQKSYDTVWKWMSHQAYMQECN